MKFSTAYPTARLFIHVAMAANTIPLHCLTDRLAKILIEKTQLDNIGILLTDRLNYPLRYRLSFMMAKKVNQKRARSKNGTPYNVQIGLRAEVCGRRIYPFWHFGRQHLGTIRQQSNHQKKVQVHFWGFKRSWNEDRGISGYITALAGLGYWCNPPNSNIIHGKHEETDQELEIASTGFEVANNYAKTQCNHSWWISTEFDMTPLSVNWSNIRHLCPIDLFCTNVMQKLL